MSSKTLTRAIRRYARKYGYSAATVRTCTALRLAAIREYPRDR